MSTGKIVPLDRTLIGLIVAEEMDPLTGERASGEGMADRMLAAPDLAWALVDDGRCMLAAGLLFHWYGRVDAWMLRSRFATKRHLIMAIDRCSEFMALRQRDPAFKRIEMFCLARPGIDTFARRLGFTYEGEHKAFDQLGRTYRSYARIAGEHPWPS